MRTYKGLTIGFIAGTAGGLVSLGGGTLVIPLLMGWLGFSPLQARGTAIAVAVFSAGMGSLVYGWHQQIDPWVVLWVALPSVLLTPVAAAWSKRLPARELKAVFGVVVMLGGLLLIFRGVLPEHSLVPAGAKTPYLLGVGVIEGLVAGVIGISGGPVLAPLFVLGLGMPQHLAQGCSLAARLPATLAGTWENARLGNIRSELVPALAAGALTGAWLGGHLAMWLPERELRQLFGVLLLVLGGHYLAAGRTPRHPG